MKQTLILDYLPCDLNTYIRHERTNKFIAAQVKKRETEAVYMQCIAQGLKPFKNPVTIHYFWYCKTKRKDKSNVAFAKKFIEDGLVMARVLKNDGWDDIEDFADHFMLDNAEQVIIDISDEE